MTHLYQVASKGTPRSRPSLREDRRSPSHRRELREKSLTALLAEGALSPSHRREEDQWLWQIKNK